MRKPRHQELELHARWVLLQSVSITPHHLAHRANIDWLVAEDVLRGLVNKSQATGLKNGRFGRAAQSMTLLTAGDVLQP